MFEMPKITVIWRFDKYYLIRKERIGTTDFWDISNKTKQKILKYNGVIISHSPASQIYFPTREDGEKFMEEVINPLLIMEVLTGTDLIKGRI